MRWGLPDVPDVARVADSSTEVLSALSGTRTIMGLKAATLHRHVAATRGLVGERGARRARGGVVRPAVIAAVTAWLLWRGIAPVAPNTPIEGATVVQRNDTEEACQKAVTIKRRTRNAVVHKGAAAYEVFKCLAEGADPARGRFE